MNVLELSTFAKDYFNELKPRNIVSGYDEYVLTNGTDIMFVNKGYKPSKGEVLFYLKVCNGLTSCTLVESNLE